MKTVQKISEQTLKLVNYLKDIRPGEYLSYRDIEIGAGVKMNEKGKTYLRSAIRKLHLEYECRVNEGIVLASEKNTTRILVHRLTKIDNSVKKGEKTYKNLSFNFFDKLNDREQKQINFIGAAFGAIRLAAENGKRLFQVNKSQNNKKIELPIEY